MTITFIVILLFVQVFGQPGASNQETVTLDEESRQKFKQFFKDYTEFIVLLNHHREFFKDRENWFSPNLWKLVNELKDLESEMFHFISDIYTKGIITKNDCEKWLSKFSTTYNTANTDNGYGRYLLLLKENIENVMMSLEIEDDDKQDIVKRLLLSINFFDNKHKVMQQLAQLMHLNRKPVFLKANNKFGDFIETLGKFVSPQRRFQKPDHSRLLPRVEDGTSTLNAPEPKNKRHMMTVTEMIKNPGIEIPPPKHPDEKREVEPGWRPLTQEELKRPTPSFGSPKPSKPLKRQIPVERRSHPPLIRTKGQSDERRPIYTPKEGVDKESPSPREDIVEPPMMNQKRTLRRQTPVMRSPERPLDRETGVKRRPLVRQDSISSVSGEKESYTESIPKIPPPKPQRKSLSEPKDEQHLYDNYPVDKNGHRIPPPKPKRKALLRQNNFQDYQEEPPKSPTTTKQPVFIEMKEIVHHGSDEESGVDELIKQTEAGFGVDKTPETVQKSKRRHLLGKIKEKMHRTKRDSDSDSD
ncbi:hypothetical protein EIN_273720 [Entamoeba invadens IP1]|uniref:Uncharacterized protein n=1 Tax=Entamoeba invadens IP1 TaxID=370355 RepID=A0A0A1U1D2_ENTIV|nr:hypothetical protein EIN_273720 [Entamoeba invadens IP1]ELP87835.1 hypothetical protein EIN_273720 [Entamoeba invadens IP1]|eukprot:XP_004254606.1 hypothetical protein EIN_273720 [Entamoeba invadens IP1]